MSQVLGYLLLALVVAFATYRHLCELGYRRACARRRFRGVRIVVTKRVTSASQIPPAPRRSTNGHRLQLVTTNYQLPTSITERVH